MISLNVRTSTSVGVRTPLSPSPNIETSKQKSTSTIEMEEENFQEKRNQKNTVKGNQNATVDTRRQKGSLHLDIVRPPILFSKNIRKDRFPVIGGGHPTVSSTPMSLGHSSYIEIFYGTQKRPKVDE